MFGPSVPVGGSFVSFCCGMPALLPVKIAEEHRDYINGVKVPGKYQKAAR